MTTWLLGPSRGSGRSGVGIFQAVLAGPAAMAVPAVLVFLAILGPIGTTEAFAQETSVRAYLSPSSVGVGRVFVVNVEITGSQNVDQEPQLPDLGDFSTYLGSGSSSSMQIINNRTMVSLTLQYRFQALEEGTFDIPAFQVRVDGETFSTEALTLTVTSAPPPDPQQPRRGAGPTAVTPEDLFVTAEASRSRILEGEPFIVEYRIFTRVNVTSYGFSSVPELEGFWVEELPLPDQPQVEQVTRNGQQYTTAVIRRVALVPTGPGERTLDPLGIEAQVRVRQPRRMLDPFESIFDLDRSSLFGSVVPVTAASNPIQLQVEALPPGRPTPFSGVVGDLRLDAEVSPDSVDADEAFTLTVIATGQGNLRAMPEPSLELPEDFEAYPPEVSESVQRSGPGLSGRKSWEYVIIPRAPGNRSIPSITTGYFDTEANAYRTASTGPLQLLVSGEMPQGPSPLVRGGVASLREDIRFIHLGPTRLTPANRSPFDGPTFWAVLLLPMMAVLAAAGLRLHQDRLERDPAYARRRRAGRVAHARLAEAKGLATGKEPRAFYAEAARALRGFVADQLDLAEAGMQVRDIQAGLARAQVSQEAIQEVLACLEHCDLKRFAPAEDDAGAETRFLDRVADVMTRLNREMKR